MKSILLLILSFTVFSEVSAQKYCANQPDNNNRTAKLVKLPSANDLFGKYTIEKPEYLPVCKSTSLGVFETEMGYTIYDNQTNSSVSNRIYAYPDGTIGAVWSMGFTSPAYFDRGTAYNYFDGTNWGAEPTARIEPMRTGSPSYYPLGNGELIVAHDVTNSLQISKRPFKGSGAWTTSRVSPPSGEAKGMFPRVITVGNTIHIIAVSVGTYQGLYQALLYYRSNDGGITWENPVIIPGLDTTSLGAGIGKSFSGFGADSYAWAAPRGDTIAFAVASCMGGAWVMKSYDNGFNWSRVTVFTVPVLTDAPSPTIGSTDGSISVAMDSEGIAHVVFGRMFVSDNDYMVEGHSDYPFTDGLVYWNETMPQLDTAQLANLDILTTQGNLIGWMEDVNGNGEIDFPTVDTGQFPFGLYGTSLSSMGQIVIDKDDKMYVTYSSCREDLINYMANPNVQLYRHLYLTEKEKLSMDWTSPRDLNDDILYSYDECVFASLSFSVEFHFTSYLDILCQIDAEPGTSMGMDADPPGDNYIYHLSVVSPFGPGIKPADIAKDVNISPNPATEYANVQVTMTDSKKVELNVFDMMGKLVMTNNYGQQTSGTHTFKVNTSSLPNGIYLFTVKVGKSQTSRKVVVN